MRSYQSAVHGTDSFFPHCWKYLDLFNTSNGWLGIRICSQPKGLASLQLKSSASLYCTRFSHKSGIYKCSSCRNPPPPLFFSYSDSSPGLMKHPRFSWREFACSLVKNQQWRQPRHVMKHVTLAAVSANVSENEEYPALHLMNVGITYKERWCLIKDL